MTRAKVAGRRTHGTSAKAVRQGGRRVAQAPAARSAARVLKVTALPTVETDNAADLLGVMMWEFDVQLPRPARALDLVLELRDRDKSPQRIVGTHHSVLADMMPASGHLKVFVGVHPLSGVLREPGKAKYMVRINSYRISPSKQAASRSSSVVADNAFSGLNTEVSCVERPDNTFALVMSNRDGSYARRPAASDVELVFTVRNSF